MVKLKENKELDILELKTNFLERWFYKKGYGWPVETVENCLIGYLETNPDLPEKEESLEIQMDEKTKTVMEDFTLEAYQNLLDIAGQKSDLQQRYYELCEKWGFLVQYSPVGESETYTPSIEEIKTVNAINWVKARLGVMDQLEHLKANDVGLLILQKGQKGRFYAKIDEAEPAAMGPKMGHERLPGYRQGQ